MIYHQNKAMIEQEESFSTMESPLATTQNENKTENKTKDPSNTLVGRKRREPTTTTKPNSNNQNPTTLVAPVSHRQLHKLEEALATLRKDVHHKQDKQNELEFQLRNTSVERDLLKMKSIELVTERDEWKRKERNAMEQLEAMRMQMDHLQNQVKQLEVRNGVLQEDRDWLQHELQSLVFLGRENHGMLNVRCSPHGGLVQTSRNKALSWNMSKLGLNNTWNKKGGQVLPLECIHDVESVSNDLTS